MTPTEISEENQKLREEVDRLRLLREKAQLEQDIACSEKDAALDDPKQAWIMFGVGVFGTLGLLYLVQLIL